MERTEQNRLHSVAKRLKTGEALFAVTNIETPKQALSAYGNQWAIERLFADAKTKSLNLEDTHMTDPKKLDTMLAVIALA